MSLIELALQRVKADSAKASPAERSTAPVQPGAVVQRHEALPGATPPVEVLNPDIHITEAFLRENGLSPPQSHEHQQRAEYRHIKYGLLRDQGRSGSHQILVTSALQGEGKSFSSFHLAMSLASEQDYTVLLVDADVIRPSLSRMLGREGQPGLINAVTDPGTNVESLIATTNVRGLSFLSAGPHNERATEHFASARMGEVMRQLLSVPNRIVVVDTLPLLLTTEARALTSLGGQIVLVVRAESTPQNAVLEAVDLLGEGANVKLLLNAAVRAKALEYYGIGHGYDYVPNNTKKEQKS
jgi:Mrp family chromosome partitioning ATPase